jgi:uncharacterized membrane protein YdjX (TVP38/TMEM64 family)
MKKATVVRMLLLITVVGSLLVLPTLSPVRQAVGQFQIWLRSLGVWGLVILAASYTPASLILFPGSLLTLGAGAAFGIPEATVAISLGSTLAAAVVFLVGRTIARPYVERRLADKPWFKPLDEAVARQGFKIVLLTRLSPVFPFTLLNYAYSLTRVSFRDYILASWLGMFPGTLMYIYLGSAAKSLVVLWSDLLAGNLSQENLVQAAFVSFGLAVTVIITVTITRIARQALARAVPSLEEQKEPSPEGVTHG